jgi:hypothetical protein
MRTKREPYKRREGARLLPDVLDAQLIARGIGTRDLARLTGLDVGTVTDARKGKRVRRTTVMKIVAALDKVPVNATAGALVGVGADLVEKKRPRKVA